MGRGLCSKEGAIQEGHVPSLLTIAEMNFKFPLSRIAGAVSGGLQRFTTYKSCP